MYYDSNAIALEYVYYAYNIYLNSVNYVNLN